MGHSRSSGLSRGGASGGGAGTGGGGAFRPSQRVSFNSGFGDVEGHIVRKLPATATSGPRADKGGYYEVAIDRGNAFVSSGESYIVGASQLKLLKNRGR